MGNIVKSLSYKKVPLQVPVYVNEYRDENKLNNQGEALAEIVDNSKMFKELGLNRDKIDKLKMVQSMLFNNGTQLTLDKLMDRLIETSLSEMVSVESLDKKTIVKDRSINGTGTARVRINHFIKMIKEHNSNSSNTLKITQTLLANGLTSGKERSINLDMIKASDKSMFLKGSNCNRKAIKRVLLDNDNFKDYNSTLSNLSTRKHNMETIRVLEVN